MRQSERRQQLDLLLLRFRRYWQPQPFRELRPAWCATQPALAAELLALDDAELAQLDNDHEAALAWLARHVPEVAELPALLLLPDAQGLALSVRDTRWAWEIPGRKQAQIEAFAAAADSCGRPVIDWCGGKGHLGRLLAMRWGQAVHTLDVDAALCDEGQRLAARLGAKQAFVVADALKVADWPRHGQHAVALHACGELHRRLLRHGTASGVQRFDVAPCCYHLGVDEAYQPLSDGLRLPLARDDVRLAVTETVTASPRLARRRDLEMAWKLGFDAYRRAVAPGGYQTFKPVPAAWFGDGFAVFLQHMAQREGLPVPGADVATWEVAGWQRRHEVMRLSLVRHAFRRALEIWLALDLAVYLEERGYAVSLARFCERRLTPRNLLISAQFAG